MRENFPPIFLVTTHYLDKSIHVLGLKVLYLILVVGEERRGEDDILVHYDG